MKATKLLPSLETAIGIPLGIVTCGSGAAACGTGIGFLVGGPAGAGLGYLLGLGIGVFGGAAAGAKVSQYAQELIHSK